MLHSDVGKVDEGRLQLLASIVAFLVQVRFLVNLTCVAYARASTPTVCNRLPWAPRQIGSLRQKSYESEAKQVVAASLDGVGSMMSLYGRVSDAWGCIPEVAHCCLMRRRRSMMGSCAMGFHCRTSPMCRFWRQTSHLCLMLCVWTAMLHMCQVNSHVLMSKAHVFLLGVALGSLRNFRLAGVHHASIVQQAIMVWYSIC